MKIIRYNLCKRVNRGTEEAPVYEDILIQKEITCADAYLEANEAIAKQEAYNGEYTIEDDGQPEVISVEDRVETLEETSATKDELQEVWDSMAAAYNEGVQNA